MPALGKMIDHDEACRSEPLEFGGTLYFHGNPHVWCGSRSSHQKETRIHSEKGSFVAVQEYIQYQDSKSLCCPKKIEQ